MQNAASNRGPEVLAARGSDFGWVGAAASAPDPRKRWIGLHSTSADGSRILTHLVELGDRWTGCLAWSPSARWIALELVWMHGPRDVHPLAMLRLETRPVDASFRRLELALDATGDALAVRVTDHETGAQGAWEIALREGS